MFSVEAGVGRGGRGWEWPVGVIRKWEKIDPDCQHLTYFLPTKGGEWYVPWSEPYQLDSNVPLNGALVHLREKSIPTFATL